MNRIKQLRNEKGLTQGELSKRIGINRVTLSNLESGTRYPTLDHLQRLSKFFDCSFDYILGKSNDRKEKVQIVEISNAGVTKLQMEFLKKIEDLNVKDIEQVFDYIDFIKSKEGTKRWEIL